MIPLIFCFTILGLMAFVVIHYLVTLYSFPSSITEVQSYDSKELIGSDIRVRLSIKDRLKVLIGRRISLNIQFKLSQDSPIASSHRLIRVVKRNTSFTTVSNEQI